MQLSVPLFFGSFASGADASAPERDQERRSEAKGGRTEKKQAKELRAFWGL